MFKSGLSGDLLSGVGQGGQRWSCGRSSWYPRLFHWLHTGHLTQAARWQWRTAHWWQWYPGGRGNAPLARLTASLKNIE